MTLPPHRTPTLHPPPRPLRSLSPPPPLPPPPPDSTSAVVGPASTSTTASSPSSAPPTSTLPPILAATTSSPALDPSCSSPSSAPPTSTPPPKPAATTSSSALEPSSSSPSSAPPTSTPPPKPAATTSSPALDPSCSSPSSAPPTSTLPPKPAATTSSPALDSSCSSPSSAPPTTTPPPKPAATPSSPAHDPSCSSPSSAPPTSTPPPKPAATPSSPHPDGRFGSKNIPVSHKIDFEERHIQNLEMVRSSKFIISPSNSYYRWWENLVVVLSLYSVLMSSFEFGFLKQNKMALIVDIVVDVLFLFDMILTFFVAYIDKTTRFLVVDKKQIAVAYLKSFFILDIISFVPSIINLLHHSLPELFCRVFYLLRISRLQKINGLLTRLEDGGCNYFWIQFVKSACSITFVVHTAACIFYFLADSHEDVEKTWISAFVSGSLRPVAILYPLAIYWAITTYTTVGYGDVIPRNLWEILFTTIYMAFNQLLTIFLANQGNSRSEELRNAINAASRFAWRTGLPACLKHEMLEEIRSKFTLESQLDQQRVVESFPTSIRVKIAHHIFGDIIRQSYLFKGVPDDFILEMVKEIKASYLSSNEDVILKNETSTNFYMLVSGVVDLINYEDGAEQIVDVAKAGSMFGEIGFFCNIPQLLTARTRCLCHLGRVDRVIFFNLLQANIQVGSVIMTNLLQFLKKEKGNPIIKKGVLEDTKNIHLAMWLAINQGDPHVCLHLLRLGVDPNKTYNHGRTALHTCALFGFESCVTHLLDYGADLNVIDFQGETPLDIAIREEKASIAGILMEYGANMDMENREGLAVNLVLEQTRSSEIEDPRRWSKSLTKPSQKTVYNGGSSSSSNPNIQKDAIGFRNSLFGVVIAENRLQRNK